MSIQVYLLDQSCRMYDFKAGDPVTVDETDPMDFLPLSPQEDPHVLNVLCGDWDCEHCSLSNQNAVARIVFDDVEKRTGVLEAFEYWDPGKKEPFKDIHLLQAEFVMTSWDANIALGEYPKYHLENFLKLSIEERIEHMLEVQRFRVKFCELDIQIAS